MKCGWLCAAGALLRVACCFAAEEPPKIDPRYPFRTDFANAHLPWYPPKPLEFPPHHSERRLSGELVSADFIHRAGQFRMSDTGELVDFTMPPYGAVNYLNAEADLREVPIGTVFLFLLNQDAQGGFTRLATMQDQFTMDASHRVTYRLDEVKLREGKLLMTKQSIPKKQPDLGKKELLVRDETRVWKGGRQVQFTDLVAGDELLFNLSGKSGGSPGWCSDIWADTETHQFATKQQAKKFAEFTKRRGVPGWIDRTEGNVVTLTFFSGDPRGFKQTWGSEFAAGKSGGKLCVANDELRTWNPPVDGEGFTILDVRDVTKESYGCSGVQIDVKVANMLEGFRRGRTVRVFAPGWKAQDQFYGESLMGYGFGRMQDQELVENVAQEYPAQFPFRTDFGNDSLPWFRVRPGRLPPPFAEHLVIGELVNADAATGSGRFRTERTGETVAFTLLPEGVVKFLNAHATLTDLPPGTRCRFSMFQDENGAFTRASLITDEFTRMAANAITYRVESLRLAEERLLVALQLPEVKDYNGDMQRPPDIARSELRVNSATRVWKGEQQVKLGDLAAGDVLLVNMTSEQNGAPSVCTDIFIGAETHQFAMGRQSQKLVKARK